MPITEMAEVNGWLLPRARGFPVEVRIPARLEGLPIIRTLITAIAGAGRLDLDDVADLRLAVDEACTVLIRGSRSGATLVLRLDALKHCMRVSVSASCVDEHVLAPGTFSRHLISCLTDEVTTFHDGADLEAGGRMSVISMTSKSSEAST